MNKKPQRMNPVMSQRLGELLRRRVVRTAEELAARTGLSKQAVGRWIRMMKEGGLLHVEDYREDSRGRMFTQVLAWGPGPDAERPGQRRTAAERMAEYRARKREEREC